MIVSTRLQQFLWQSQWKFCNGHHTDNDVAMYALFLPRHDIRKQEHTTGIFAWS